MSVKWVFSVSQPQIPELKYLNGPNASSGPNAPSWWRHQMETFSALLAICAGNSLVTCEFSRQRPVTRSFDVLFDLRLNKRLNKQSWGWRSETPLRSLWLHCNVNITGCDCDVVKIKTVEPDVRNTIYKNKSFPISTWYIFNTDFLMDNAYWLLRPSILQMSFEDSRIISGSVGFGLDGWHIDTKKWPP